ncbi:hypothetical protein ACTMTJ_42555 [Phytohabitans sp. LJ34]|uniref:hypothetical protein n=1 Tax=Phytohabitans sp. LJ34 TaxID=3452217 RepID=UPI003F8BC759
MTDDQDAELKSPHNPLMKILANFRGQGRRVAVAGLALSVTTTVAMASAQPAAADPPYAKPNLKVLSCGVFDDPVDYGDGIDWWKFRFTYTNNGLVATPGAFKVGVHWVWTATGGPESSTEYWQPRMVKGQVVTREFWVTPQVATYGLASVMLDSGYSVDEYGFESDNHCWSYNGGY